MTHMLSKWIAAFILSASAWSASLAADCLYYGPVNLTGRLVQQTYPGPPDFESVTKGDEALVIWILQLDYPVCIISSDASHPNVYNEGEVQIVLGSTQYARSDRYADYRYLLGRKVAVAGRLVPGGGKYEKHFVIRAESLRNLSDR